jgi:hypothetical protein
MAHTGAHALVILNLMDVSTCPLEIHTDSSTGLLKEIGYTFMIAAAEHPQTLRFITEARIDSDIPSW